MPDDLHAPAFRIVLGGQPRPDLVADTLRFELRDSVDEPGRFELTLADAPIDDGGAAHFKYADDETLDVGATVELSIGFGDRRIAVMGASITSISPTFPSDGAPTLTLRGVESTERLRLLAAIREAPRLRPAEPGLVAAVTRLAAAEPLLAPAVPGPAAAVPGPAAAVSRLVRGEDLASIVLERTARDFITGRGSSVGLAELRPGDHVELGGLGARFDGTYYVRTVDHVFDHAGGYRTSFDVQRGEAPSS